MATRPAASRRRAPKTRKRAKKSRSQGTAGREFQTLVDQVYGLLAGQTKTEPEELGSAPGEPGHTRGLPHVPVGELAGFLEHLSQLPGQQADVG